MCELFDKIFSDSLIFLTFIIALATVLYMVFTVLMWLSMRRSINLTKQNFELTNRPFIGINRVDVKFVDNGRLNPFFEYINFGNVPAKEIIIEFFITINSKQVFNFNSTINNIFPTNTSMWADVFELDFKSMFSSNDTFIFTMNISYNGVTKTKYSTKELYKYDSIGDKFTTIESVWN